MIEKVLISYFSKEITVPIYAEIPSKPPKEFIVLRKMGGGLTNMVSAATISFESFSTSLQKAAELDAIVQRVAMDSISLDEISSAKLGGESSNIDTNNKRYSYESIFNFYYYR